jgi:hypothetical protein
VDRKLGILVFEGCFQKLGVAGKRPSARIHFEK